MVVAITRVTTRYEKGRVPETSIASICSDTLILPNSAPMLRPSFPAQISPVMSGPSDLTTACDTKDGSHDSAPKEASDGRDCRVNTMPAMNEVNPIRKNDLYPIRKHCRSSSLNSNG